MPRPNWLPQDLFTLVAIGSATLSIIVSILAHLSIPPFLHIFQETGMTPSLFTQLIFASYPWIWLGAVFSGITWLLVQQRLLPQTWGWFSLSMIVYSTIAYVILGMVTIYWSMQQVFESLGMISQPYMLIFSIRSGTNPI